MMRLLYRFFHAFHVDRLFTQHKFEAIATSPEGLRIARAWRARVGGKSDG